MRVLTSLTALVGSDYMPCGPEDDKPFLCHPLGEICREHNEPNDK